MTAQIQLPAWKLIIVEDDPLMQLGLEQALAAYPPLEVLAIVDDGFLAVEAILQQQPDLVLMDIGLPGLDGIEVTQRVKRQLPTLKVIMLTSHTSETEVFAAFASGADGYCIKGGSLEVLMTSIITVHQDGVFLDPKIARMVMGLLKPPANGAKQRVEPLSKRELEVLQLLVEGMSNVEIGAQLHLSPNTIKAYMRGLMNKLVASDRVQVAVKALQAGLV
jgi:two-component system, NarL family, response regulator LiaR